MNDFETIPHHAQSDWPAVVVAGAFQTGVVLMRNLHRRGLKVYCFDCVKGMAGYDTVYAESSFCPNPDDQPEQWVAFMVALGQRIGGRPVLIPAADRFVSAMGEHTAALEPYFRFCYSASGIQALFATKQRQYSVAADNGMPVPLTRFASTPEEVEEFASIARFPCLFKPLHERCWFGVPPDHLLAGQKLILAQDAQQLRQHYQTAAAVAPEVVLQEIILGPDTAKMVYLSCYGNDGRRCGYSVVRQIRTLPINFGSASVVEPVDDPEVARLCDEFLKAIGYKGLCEIEVKRDTRDGVVKMIEANPRYSVTADAAPYDGVDLGWLHYLDLIGQPVGEVAPQNRDFRHVVLFRDLATLGGYRRAGKLSAGNLFGAYRPPVYFFDFDIRDRRVTWKNLKGLAAIILGPWLRRWFKRS